MRRALGLHNASPTQDRPVPPPASPGASSPQRRRFVRDGEVPVSVIRRDQDDGANTNKLDATRQALREQIEARERRNICSRRLRRRSTTSRPNWPMSGSPGMRRSSVWTARSRLSNRPSRGRRRNWRSSGTGRQKAEQERDDAIAARQEAEERIQEMLATLDAQKASQAPPRPTHDPQTTRRQGKSMPTTEPSAGGDKVKQPRRRGRPAKSDQSEAEIVEWWKPGWQKQFR